MANFKKYINNKNNKKIKIFMKNHHGEKVYGNLFLPSGELLLEKNTKATLDYKKSIYDKDRPSRLKPLQELKNSVLTRQKNKELYFIEDIIFNSPTGASTAILGRTTGLREWTIFDSGEKLNKDLLNQLKNKANSKLIESEEKSQYNFDKEKLEKQTQSNNKKINKFIISTKDPSRSKITERSIQEIADLFTSESKDKIIYSKSKKENGIFELWDGRQGIILTNNNNTLPGKIYEIKEILKSSGECWIYVPKELRKSNNMIRFVKLLNSAYDKINILDPNWITIEKEFNIPNGNYWKKIYNVSTKNSTTKIHVLNSNTFYNYQEAGMLALYYSKKHNHQVLISGNINGQYIRPEFLSEWKHNNIINKVTHNSKEINIPNRENEQKGELQNEQTPGNSSSKSNPFEREFNNEHEILAIKFSNYLREQYKPTEREFLDIDIVEFHSNKIINIYEVKTSASEVYKAIGQLLTYQLRIKYRQSQKPQMHLVLPKKIIIDEEKQKVLQANNIFLIHF